jgi:hypothetical protein
MMFGSVRYTPAHLVAGEHIPSDSMMVLSFSDTAGLWNAAKQTSVYQGVSDIFRIPLIQSNPDFQQFLLDKKTAEQRLGFSLDPESLLTNVITGMDMALTLREQKVEEPDLVVIVKFKTPELAQKILKEIETEAEKSASKNEPAQETGAIDKPKPVSPVQRQTIAGQTVMVIPEDGLWACQKGNLVIFSSSERMMTRSLNSPAEGGIRKSEFIGQAMNAMGKPTSSHMFLYMDYVGILKAVTQNNPTATASLKMFENMVTNLRLVAIANVAADHLEIRGYAPNPGNDPAFAELASLYPPSEIQARRFSPAGTLLSAFWNNFDGPRQFDPLMRMFAKAGAAEIESESSSQEMESLFEMQMKQQLGMIEAMLGFKIKDDLLAAIGPEVGLVLDNVTFNPLTGPIPVVDIALVSQIRDKAKLDLVLGKIESYLTTQLPMLMQAGGAKPSPLTMRSVTFREGMGKVLVLPQVPAYTPGWIIAGNYVVIGSTENALKKASQAYSGEVASLTTSPEYRKASAYLPQKTNSEFILGVKNIVTFISNLAVIFGGANLEGDQGVLFLALMDTLKTLEVAYASSSSSTKGETILTSVILFGPYVSSTGSKGASSAPPPVAPPSEAPADSSKPSSR